jgi:hypothetical protein
MYPVLVQHCRRASVDQVVESGKEMFRGRHASEIRSQGDVGASTGKTGQDLPWRREQHKQRLQCGSLCGRTTSVLWGMC